MTSRGSCPCRQVPPTSGGEETAGASGFNEYRVEAVLYAPFTGPQTMPEISAEAIRAFTVIVANTAAPIQTQEQGRAP